MEYRLYTKVFENYICAVYLLVNLEQKRTKLQATVNLGTKCAIIGEQQIRPNSSQTEENLCTLTGFSPESFQAVVVNAWNGHILRTFLKKNCFKYIFD